MSKIANGWDLAMGTIEVRNLGNNRYINMKKIKHLDW